MSKAHIMKVPLTTDHFGVKRIGPGSEHATWKYFGCKLSDFIDI